MIHLIGRSFPTRQVAVRGVLDGCRSRFARASDTIRSSRRASALAAVPEGTMPLEKTVNLALKEDFCMIGSDGGIQFEPRANSHPRGAGCFATAIRHGLRIGMPLEKILEKIRQLRTDKVRAAYVKELRAQTSVTIALAPPKAKVEVGEAQVLGPKSAKVVLVEFADYECPYCQRVAPDVKKLKDEYGDRIAFTYKDFPLPNHSRAEKAAEATRCASKQNKFWEYQEVLYNWQPQYISGAYNPNDTGRLAAAAAQIGMDKDKFNSCVNSQAAKDFVDKSNNYANSRGMTATPTIFIDKQLIYPLQSGSSPDLNQIRGMLEAPASQ